MPGRVCVIGCCGAGKTVLANRLGARLGLPVTHLDHHYWRPGWQRPDPETWRRTVARLVAPDAWVLDGNYAGTLDIRLPRAELVVVVDYPRQICLARAVLRLLRSRGRPYNVPGCPERIDRRFLCYLWRWPDEGRPRTLGLVGRYADPAAVVRLEHPVDANGWLAGLESDSPHVWFNRHP